MNAAKLSKWLLVAALAIATGPLTVASGDETARITGAGATFPYPIYAKWAYAYEQLTKVQVNYQAIGSGGGISQIKAKTVDFGASDAPLTADELKESGLVQFPMVIGGIVPVVHLEGVQPNSLRLTSQLLADIFLGKVKSWDDPAIKAANPSLTLPASEIVVVHRADGSGTTWIFTKYLEQVSADWKEKVGSGKAVQWPVGVGGKGNEGVAAYVSRLEGSIGYVEYAYALQNKMTSTLLSNHDGKMVEAKIETFQAAAANADWKNAPGYYMVLVDQPGDDSWPITGASFILMQKQQANAKQATAILKFFDWCLKQGGASAKELHYVPLPSSLVEMVEGSWDSTLAADGQPIAR